jgi:hypothetical protein
MLCRGRVGCVVVAIMHASQAQRRQHAGASTAASYYMVVAPTLLLLLAIVFALPHTSTAPPPQVQAASPPRGWNSYDSFTWRVTEAEFLANCQYVADHLLAHGYEYCVVDYLWFMDLNATATDGSPWTPGENVASASLHVDVHGRPLPAPDRWPSAANGAGFAGVAAKVKSMGLKMGVHMMRGALSAAVAAHSPVLGGGGATVDQIAMSSLTPSKDGPGKCPWYLVPSCDLDRHRPGGRPGLLRLTVPTARELGCDVR